MRREMDRALAVMLALAMAAAVALCFARVGKISEMEARQAELTRLLAESRAAWTQTDAEKVALQDRQKAAEDALREAKLSLSESTDKIASITAQLEELAVRQAEDEAALEALRTRTEALSAAMDAVRSAADDDALAKARAALETLLTGGEADDVGAE